VCSQNFIRAKLQLMYPYCKKIPFITMITLTKRKGLRKIFMINFENTHPQPALFFISNVFTTQLPREIKVWTFFSINLTELHFLVRVSISKTSFDNYSVRAGHLIWSWYFNYACSS
jgi:hypothetical protein